jgi:hypothetical protein
MEAGARPHRPCRARRGVDGGESSTDLSTP